MQLELRPYPTNTFPLSGILIRGASPHKWMVELERMQLSVEQLQIFPVPGKVANSVWGCFVLQEHKVIKEVIGTNELCQKVASNLYIAERSVLFPKMKITEIERSFSANVHVFHPDFGLAELSETVDVEQLIHEPTVRSYYVTKPDAGIFIPGTIRSFQIESISPEEMERKMEERLFPKKESMKQEPLNLFEKAKLLLYKALLSGGGDAKASVGGSEQSRRPLNMIERAIDKLLGKNTGFVDKMLHDMEDLERRNQKEMDKLLDMLKKNPEEALKYAIPINDTGGGRGGSTGTWSLSKMWSDFSLFGQQRTTYSGSGSIDLGSRVNELQAQYTVTAEAMIKEGKYHNAAFIYMKLLKNNFKAAEVLEQGKFYGEAAIVYRKNAHKAKAAECYEKGNMIADAIDVHIELENNEKVGDLYVVISKRKEANVYYEKVIEDHKASDRYVKASLVYKYKMNDARQAQSMLLDGWENNKDATNCLTFYFSNIDDIKELGTEIERIGNGELTQQKSEAFLDVTRHEFDRKDQLEEPIRELAYKIIAREMETNPSIVTKLRLFNPNDRELIKDAMKYKMNSWGR